jgi:hypothetical protein
MLSSCLVSPEWPTDGGKADMAALGFVCIAGDLLWTVRMPRFFASLSDAMHAAVYGHKRGLCKT